MSGFPSAVSQRPSPLLPKTLFAFLGLKLPPEPPQKPPSPPNPPEPPDPPDPPPAHSFTDSLILVSPPHSLHLNLAPVLAVNYLGSLSLFLTLVSSTETSLAFTRAFTAVCSFCSRFVLVFSCTKCQICSLFSWQPRLSQFPFPIILTSEGMMFVTLLLVLQWSTICLRLVPSSLSMRFHQYQFQLPQYEDVTLIMFNQSFARMAGMSLNGRHICSQSLEIILSCFGVNLYGLGYLSDCFDGDSDFPCIEGFFRLVLTFSVAKGLVPFISFGIYCVVDALWEDLCFPEEDVTSKSIRESREWNEAFVSPPSSCRINSSFCGLGMFFQEAGSCVSPKHLSIRPYVLSASITNVHLALRCALHSAVETVINLLKVFLNIQTLFGLTNSKVSRIEFCGFIHEISLFMSPFDPISYPFRPFSFNVVVVAVELSTPALLFLSFSSNGV